MERQIWIDWSKSIAILLMVMGHTFRSPEIIYTIIISFHMPSFLIISGYLFKKTSLIKVFLQFAIPVFMISCMEIILMLPLNNYSISEIFSNSVFISLSNEKSPIFNGLWFIVVLCIIKMLLSIDIIKKHYKIITISLLSVLLILDVLGIRFGGRLYISKVIFSFPFVAFGLYLKEHNIVPCFHRKRYLSLIIITFLCIALVNKCCDIYSTNYGYGYCIAFIGAVLGSLSLYSLVAFLPKNSIIQTISSGTLIILGLHAPLLGLISRVYPEFLKPIYFILAPLIVILLCYPVIAFCLKYCKWMLGRFQLLK